MKIHTWILLVCLSGCGNTAPITDGPTANNEVPATDNSNGEKRPYDWGSCMGIHDANSPNGELWHWMWVRQTEANEIPNDLLASIESGGPSELLLGRRERFDESGTIPGVLDLSNYKLNSRGKEALVDNHEIRWLHLGRDTTAEDFNWLGKMHQLIGLRIVNADLSNADFSKLKDLSNIRWLSIASPKNLPEDFDNWPAFPAIETLDLTGNIPDQLVSVFRDCKKLRSVHFTFTSIGDAGIRTLVTDHPNLEYLNLYRSEVTAGSVADLLRLERIALLGIGLTPLSPNVSRTEGVAELERGLPLCNVDYGD